MLICSKPHEKWVLGQLTGQRGQPIRLLEDQVFSSIDDAERHVFKLRWKKHEDRTQARRVAHPAAVWPGRDLRLRDGESGTEGLAPGLPRRIRRRVCRDRGDPHQPAENSQRSVLRPRSLGTYEMSSLERVCGLGHDKGGRAPRVQ